MSLTGKLIIGGLVALLCALGWWGWQQGGVWLLLSHLSLC